MWDPSPPSKHASPLPAPPPSNLRLAHVTTATPAKRITFYKSGDSQFGGVRMAIHKRSFKCFDALLDDLSQKVPLPFGVRTVTTPRGTNTIKHLEQLQDGGCYLCSDRRQAKPINMELANKRPSIWHHHSRRPHRPETSPTTPPGHLPYRQRRILLVKNSEPGMRRSVVLSRRSTRSMRVFLDEVSEVMQFHVRKLYTAEGRRIDNVQSLMTCPGVLVCVGREAFSPMLVNFIKKSSEEKLPGLGNRSPGLGPRTPGNGARSPATQGARSPPHGAQSRASEYSEGHESKKNDLLKETMAARPQSQQSKASKTSDKTRSEKSAKCQRIRNKKDQREELELTPACLPNASPIEVVSDWLRSIPANSSMLALGDELSEGEQEKEVEEKPEEVAKREKSPKDERVDKEEKSEAEEGVEKEGEAKCDAVEEEKSSDPAPGDAVGTSSEPNTQLPSGESLPRNWHSSAAIMKVLLSSSLGRCRSMPEVSPVYGRRLSTSARGLLDCLAHLQLIEPAVNPGCDLKDHSQQYENIMAILQSLWLTEPRDIDAKRVKDVGTEQVTPPRSSSGVDMRSGSGGSGKENGNQGGDETPPKETESLHEDEGAKKVVEDEERNAEDKEIEAEQEEASKEQATKDIAEEQMQSDEQSTVPPSLDSPKATENPSSSDKSSANDSSKSPTDNEQDTVEDSSSGTPPTVLRAPLTKKLSQDPDPVWVLHLLKKLEKQFINHYINAMAEFKVRWDLDDSLILDTMIAELRDEVSRRIQSSIEREMKKIQSRAGRGGRSPRPPQGGNLSRESTMTEKRRRMLKVMKNQSVKTADSLSDGEMTGDFSDQRSDDEYCPCDACVRKKMAARPLKTNPMAAEAPVIMEFDLLKILQLKKSPSPAPAVIPQPTDVEDDRAIEDEEGRNLEVVREEEEEEDETKEDIKAEVVLEETIPEEDEEIGEEEAGEEFVEGNVSASAEAEDEDDGDEEESHEDGGGESGEPGGESSEEERASPKVQGVTPAVCVTEGEEADAEDSDTDNKHPSDTSADESGREGAGTTGGEEEKEGGGDRDEEVVEDAVEEFKPEEEDKEEANSNKREDGALLHQFTRTSVESQPGSLEDIDTDSPSNPVSSIEVPKMAASVSTGGGTSQKRNRSPARVKRHQPKESDSELDNS
ncbi:retinitis pigmentosa 1-like 1 protein [Lates japonicus]|uniref:Retinitis pigmentosa 1-like 1 protein n=1 Tax=Lates japonicus TaxID=270547 RepID=A0AAD3N2G3_LATJO|nr:retinitis pigmentosa 1-like 1 protein [Lates japonicus]